MLERFLGKRASIKEGEVTKGHTPRPARQGMVFDAVCKSYVQEDLALKVDTGENAHYFCGGECLQKFINTRDNPY